MISLVAPFAGWLVRPSWANKVISRAYDSLTPEQRQLIVADNPYSYMNVTRGPEDSTEGAASHEELVAHGRAALTRLLKADAFAATGRKALYLYRLSHSHGEQTGVVCAVAVTGFIDGRIRVHEDVHSERAALLRAHLLGVGATSSPVAMALRSSQDLLGLLNNITATQPAELEFGSEDVRHQVWTVPEAHNPQIVNLLNDKVLYVTDGHHRSAAAIQGLKTNPNNPVLHRLLAILFCDEQLHVQTFYRLAVDQKNRTTEECLAALAAHVRCEPVGCMQQAQPNEAGIVGLYLNGKCYKLHLPPVAVNASKSSAVSQLDVERLRQQVLAPVLGLNEINQPEAIEYLPASAGYEEMIQRCDAQNRLGFALCPMSVAELFAVADEGGLMPPKSSFFSPKPRSGVFLRPLGRGATAHLPAA